MNVSGFYGYNKAVSAAENSIAFANGKHLFLVDGTRDRHVETPYEIAQVAQKGEEIWAVAPDFYHGQLLLLRFSRELELLGSRPLCSISERTWDSQLNVLSESCFFSVLPPGEADGQLTVRRVPLAGDMACEEWRVSGRMLEGFLPPGEFFHSFQDRIERAWADGERLLLDTAVWTCTDSKTCLRSAMLLVEDGALRPLWLADHENSFAGKPRFFDFDQGVMWTHPCEGEYPAEWEHRRQRHWGNQALPLMAREMALGAPALEDHDRWVIWDAFPTFYPQTAYFDGKRCFAVFTGETLTSLDVFCGTPATDWDGKPGDRAYTAVYWKGRALMDLKGDGNLTAVPLTKKFDEIRAMSKEEESEFLP